MKRTLKALLVVVLALVLGAGAIVVVFNHTFYPTPPPPAFPPPRDAGEAQQQDAEYLGTYFSYEKSYSPEALQEAKALWADLKSKAADLPPAAFDLRVGQIAALANNGHSRLQPLSLARRHPRLPCRFYRFDDGYRILRARGACVPWLGAKVVAIDGRDAEPVAEAMYPYFGGPENHYRQFASVFFLESPDLLRAKGLARDASKLSLHLITREGEERDVVMDAEPPGADSLSVYSDEYLSPSPLDDEPPEWKTALSPEAQLPLFLQDYRNPFHARSLLSGVYYVQLRSNDDEPGYPLKPFLKRVRQEIAELRPRTVILDLRLDQGGNLVKTAGFMKDLGGLSESIAHVYVLTSAWTFSAGLVSVALVKEHAGAKALLVGQAAGDRLRFWAEGGRLMLPNSRLRVNFATGEHDYAKGCAGEAGCFWVTRFLPTHLSTLEPDVKVPYTFGDYAALRDPLLERALAP